MAHHLSGLGRLLQSDLPFGFLLGGIGSIQYTAGLLDGLQVLVGTVIWSAIATAPSSLRLTLSPVSSASGLSCDLDSASSSDFFNAVDLFRSHPAILAVQDRRP